MKIQLKDGLPYGTVSLTYQGNQTTFSNVLIDTGSGGTVFAADKVLAVGLQLEPNDVIERIRGVGGTEFVFTKQVGVLSLGDLTATDFEIEVGAMAYGFELDGILGMDFLLQVGAVIDLGQLEIRR